MFDGIQSALNPYGPNAALLAELSWILFIGGTVIFVAVMALLAWALLRRPAWLGSRAAIVGGGIVFPFVVLTALLVYSLARAIPIYGQGEPAVRIHVVGHQWWWEVAYLTREGEVDFITANELRIPVGERVEVLLHSADVLHSFWVPTLAGKLDLIPGKDNRLQLVAERAGIVRGQCAEYCGGPHAQMAFFVAAMEEEAFERWRALQRLPALPTEGKLAELGKALFLQRCAACHTVRGTPAIGELGPDLTHVGSRLSLAAGILPNNVGTAAAWIASSQHIKPGNLMPSFDRQFTGEELQALAVYIESLK